MTKFAICRGSQPGVMKTLLLIIVCRVLSHTKTKLEVLVGTSNFVFVYDNTFLTLDSSYTGEHLTLDSLKESTTTSRDI